jgi:hypothetical protein
MSTLLLAASDLMAGERVRSAATHLGIEVRAVAPARLLEALRADVPDILVCDLDQGREPMLADLETARAEDVLPRTVVGYYSHVDAALGDAARAAGCTPVRRGRFWSDLPSYLEPAPPA